MVSTRAVRLKFLEGEKVLCYEPDPTKAKVLYDSKVLDIITNKDHRGRKLVEYLIHFQGWNSSWDRCVGEEYVLKDTPENRQLQKDLAQKSQLHIGAYLYRRERKKHGRKSETVNASSEDGSCGSPTGMDDDERQTTSSEYDSSADDDLVPIELTRELQERLEHDFYVLNNGNKIHRLPAEPNIVTILESYAKHHVNNQMFCVNEKPNRYRPYSTYTKIQPEDLQRNINVCREVLDGIRIYFDFTLVDLLLYKVEQNQVQVSQAKFSPLKLFKDENMPSKIETGEQEYPHLPTTDHIVSFVNENNLHDDEANMLVEPSIGKRALRSSHSLDANSNGTHADGFSLKPMLGNNNNSNDAHNTVTRIPQWKALPDPVYNQHPPPPCLIYGATHLTRLFVKLPEMLNSTNMPDEKLKVLLTHLNSLMHYLSNHKEWFGDGCYVERNKRDPE